MDVHFHIEKRYMYVLVLITIVLAGALFVKGYGTNDPATFGHTWGELACTTDLCVKEGTRRVGIGTQQPASALHVNGDIILSKDQIGQRYILHGKPNSQGERFFIAPDNADGTWDWQGGLEIVRNPRDLLFNNQRVCLQNGDGCSNTLSVYSCPNQASYQQCSLPSTCVGQLSMTPTCTYYTPSACQPATNSCQLVGYLTP